MQGRCAERLLLSKQSVWSSEHWNAALQALETGEAGFDEFKP
jgi:hypothetical protein